MDRRSKHLSSEERGVILAEHERGSSQRAIGHFLGGEDIEAVSLLTPQLENSLRHILALKAYPPTFGKAGRKGISLPARYIHEIDLLFNFAGGPSVRNQIAHGKVPAGRHWDHNFVYAAWLIIHLAILPIARRWGNVEEIFARTTGLYRPVVVRRIAFGRDGLSGCPCN